MKRPLAGLALLLALAAPLAAQPYPTAVPRPRPTATATPSPSPAAVNSQYNCIVYEYWEGVSPPRWFGPYPGVYYLEREGAVVYEGKGSTTPLVVPHVELASFQGQKAYKGLYLKTVQATVYIIPGRFLP